MRAVPALLLTVLAVQAHAQGPTVVKPLDGYACARLNATEAEMLNPHGTGIVIRTQPNPSAPVGTTAPSVVFVRHPLHVVNGFAEVMQITGKPGWIAADKIKPFDSLTRCAPSLMSNGRIGAG